MPVDPLSAAIMAAPALISGIGGMIMRPGEQAAAQGMNWQIAQAQMNQQQQFFDRNEALQREFAKMGIQWRVEDAKAAGLHPLAAIGAAGAAYSPQSYIPSEIGNAYSSGPSSSTFLSQMGQDVSRALMAAQSPAERAVTKAVTGHDLTMMMHREENARLQNELLRSQLSKLTGTGPGVGAGASSGLGIASGALGNYEPDPNKVTTAAPGRSTVAAGPGAPYVSFADVGNGLRPMPPQNLKIEDEFGAPQMAIWLADVSTNPSAYKPSPGQVAAKFGPGVDVVWDAHRWLWRKQTFNDVFPPYKRPVGGLSNELVSP